MPSTDRRLELKAKNVDGSDRLTAGCVLIDLARPGVSQTSVYAKGLNMLHTLRFSLQNAVYFMMLPFLVPVLIHILHTGCAKI